jgi:hypothetical protein
MPFDAERDLVEHVGQWSAPRDQIMDPVVRGHELALAGDGRIGHEESDLGRDGRRDPIEHPRLGRRPFSVGLAEDADPPQLLPVDVTGASRQAGPASNPSSVISTVASESSPAQTLTRCQLSRSCRLKAASLAPVFALRTWIQLSISASRQPWPSPLRVTSAQRASSSTAGTATRAASFSGTRGIVPVIVLLAGV